jgi:acylaminoacyl-peptidase
VDFFRNADTATGFPGLFVDQLPKRLWISPTKIITSSAWRLRRTLLSVDVVSGLVQELTPPDDYPGSTTALFANARWILTTYSTPTQPWTLMIGQIDFGKQNDTTAVHFSALEVCKVENAKHFYATHSWSIVDKIPGQLESLEALYLQPFRSDSKYEEAQSQSAVSGTKPPLVIMPHGGPHSGFSTEFSVLNTFLLGLGFAVACGNDWNVLFALEA